MPHLAHDAGPVDENSNPPSVIVSPEKAAGKASLIAVKGIGEVYADKLTAAGISDAAALANASVEEVAAALELKDPGRARALINEAQLALGQS